MQGRFTFLTNAARLAKALRAHVLLAGVHFLLGVPVGPAAFAQVPGMALQLDGADDYVATDRIFGQPPALTICAWVKIDPGPAGPAAVIVGNHRHGTQWESVELKAGGFNINYSPSNLTRQSIAFPALNDGEWHHLAAVWDGAVLLVYKDGALHAGPQAAPNGPWLSPNAMYIGGRHSVISPPVVDDYPGVLDEVQIWNVARTPAQIVALMHSALGPEYTASPDSGLVGYWRFEQFLDLGAGVPGPNDVRDLSFSNGVGDVVGATLVSPGTVSAPAAVPQAPLGLVASPNPFRTSTVLSFAPAADGPARLQLVDVTGRVVAELRSSDGARGTTRVTWDGRDSRGRAVPAGVYFCRAERAGRVDTQRITRLR